MTNTFVSLATCAPYIEYTKEDRVRQIREDIDQHEENLLQFRNALRFEKITDKYEFWKEWFIYTYYEDFRITMEFPKFLENYTNVINGLIDDETDLLRKCEKKLELESNS